MKFFSLIALSFLFIQPTPVLGFSFKQTGFRFGAPHDALRYLRQTFFQPGTESKIPDECKSIGSKNAYINGEADPATGKPRVDEIGSAFITWYSSCLFSYIQADFSTIKPDGEGLNRYFKASLLRELPDSAQTPWDNLSQEQKLRAELKIIEKLMGPDEVVDDLMQAPYSSIQIATEMVQTLEKVISDPSVRSPKFLKFLGVSSLEPRKITLLQAAKILTYLTGLKEVIFKS